MANSQFLILGTHLQGVFNNIIDAVNGKQPKEAGKGLSTNDFTTAYKTKLDGIEAGAQVNNVDFSTVTVNAVDISSDRVGGSFALQFEGAVDVQIAESLAIITVPDMTYTLPIATATLLGGVKVGSGLTINASTGVLSIAAGYATETYVNNAVAAVIDAAPAALDTLNELAAALGDDANFATTITTALSSKVEYEYLGTAQEAIDLLVEGGGLNALI